VNADSFCGGGGVSGHRLVISLRTLMVHRSTLERRVGGVTRPDLRLYDQSRH
jgi:hypothetical protein